ncbi:protein kinase domain-containing protein [Sorangium sp. So ce854]|uniref:serine/threonine-protein kinase n=1 Tax=Sorangium sp. So ce854 TaxID=3133322 RepID=UPI003F5F87DA
MNPGQQVTSTLRLSRQLGKGAMGSVWVADHLTLGTQVAVKFMSPAYAEQGGFVERFRREAMAAAQIKSPHVAQVFDHGVTHDGAPFIVMELLEGEDLKRRIQRLGVLSPVEVATIVAQTARALGRAHQLGIVHRDIKPDNIFLLDVEGELFVKVLDFGVAKRVHGAPQGDLGMTSTGHVLGTPLYMSPEQILSAKNVDFHADLWGLAVVAYHALTGHLPFTGETLGALSVALHAGIFTPPSAVRPELSPAIDAWMRKALALDPAARFGSARQMAEALEHAVLGIARTPFTNDPPSAGDRISHAGAARAASQPVLFGAPAPLPAAPGLDAAASAPGLGAPASAPGFGAAGPAAPDARLSTSGTPASAPGARLSTTGTPASAPGARLSTTGTPGRTLAGMATSEPAGPRRWAPAIAAAALALGALVAVVVFLTARRSPTVDVTPSADDQAAQRGAPDAQPAGPAAQGTAAVPASAAPLPVGPARPADAAEPATTAAAEPATTAAAEAVRAAATAGAATAATPVAQAGRPADTAGAQPGKPAATASKAGATAAPRGTADGRGRTAPRDPAAGRTSTRPLPPPPEDTIGF